MHDGSAAVNELLAAGSGLNELLGPLRANYAYLISLSIAATFQVLGGASGSMEV